VAAVLNNPLGGCLWKINKSADGLGIRAVAADEPVGAEAPHVAQLADRIIGTGRRLVRVGEALAPLRQQ